MGKTLFLSGCALIFAAGLVACGSDGGGVEKEPTDMNADPSRDPGGDGDGDDGARGEEGDGDGDGDDPGDGMDGEGDAGSSPGPDPDGEDAGVEDPLGLGCNELPALGLYITPKIETKALPAAKGGTIVRGRYHLSSEQRYATPSATATDKTDCEAFWGVYRETMEIGKDTWQRSIRFDDGTEGRQTFSFEKSGTSVLSRQQVCPEASVAFEFESPYTASGDELVIYDIVRNDALFGQPVVCEYAYTYVLEH